MLSVDYGGIGAVGRRRGREKEGREEEEEREGGREGLLQLGSVLCWAGQDQEVPCGDTKNGTGTRI